MHQDTKYKNKNKNKDSDTDKDSDLNNFIEEHQVNVENTDISNSSKNKQPHDPNVQCVSSNLVDIALWTFNHTTTTVADIMSSSLTWICP